MKYIVVEADDGSMQPVIFREQVTHKDVARGLHYDSAGFYEIINGKVRAYGRSDSIGIDSNPERDSRLIAILFGKESFYD